jgi:DNA polymerase I
MPIRHETEEQRWAYNAEDCVRTREVGEATTRTLEELGLTDVDAFQHKLFWPVLHAMLRGVLIDQAARNEMSLTLLNEMGVRSKWLVDVLGHELNPRSTTQMQGLFYGDFQLPIQKHKVTRQPTLDDSALEKLAFLEPLVQPIIRRVQELRSLGVFLSTFVRAPLDADGRMRCSYNICGTETYRFSSSANAFGNGTNLQNIPKGTEPDDPLALSLPNIRRLFLPDPGFTFFDLDLDRADLQVVIWEADDAEFKAMLREGVDIHKENARVLGVSRELAKRWVHGTNYGGSPRTMGQSCGISTADAERMQRRWFAAHPGIKRWHERTGMELSTRHYVENRFGYRRHYFDRVDSILPEALAWLPQSTVACVINRIWLWLWGNARGLIEVLLQVHDSLAGQFPIGSRREALVALRRAASQVVVPYDDPLIIPVGIKTSSKSWGDCVVETVLH